MDVKEIYKTAKHYLRVCPHNTDLKTKEDRQTVISNIVMIIVRKINEGVITDDIEQNKNYFFIVTRNEVFKYLKLGSKAYKNTYYYEDMVAFENNVFKTKTFGYDARTIQIMAYLKDKNQLWYDYMKYKLDGYNNVEIKKMDEFKDIKTASMGCMIYEHIRNNIEFILRNY